jgi:hypothetical protein
MNQEWFGGYGFVRSIGALVRTPLPRLAESCRLSLRNCIEISRALGLNNFCSITLLIERRVINPFAVAHGNVAFHQREIGHPPGGGTR